MGFVDRLLDFVARWGSPAMDHPARGGTTGDDPIEDDETAPEDAE